MGYHGETIHEALRRECLEELGRAIEIRHLTGIYYHARPRSHVFIFRCALPAGAEIRLSDEHDDARFFPVDGLPPVQRHRVQDCLAFEGEVRSACF